MWTAVAAVPSPDLLPGHVLRVPGLSTSISTSWRDSSSTWPPSASSWPPSSSKSSPLHQATRKNLHQTNPCAVETNNSNKVIKVVFMVSNVLYNIQQHEIKWGIYRRSQCSVYLFTTLMTSSRTSRKWPVSEAIINQSKSDLYKSFSNKGFVSRLK